MSFIEAVMMGGCPHCADGVPKIVTFHHIQHHVSTSFVGDWEDEWKNACMRYGELKIISCRPIENEDDQEDGDHDVS